MTISEIEPPQSSRNGDAEPTLFHYTSYVGLSGIVSSKSIWCTKIQYLNDRNELRHGLEILSDVCEKEFSSVSFLEKISQVGLSSKGINVFVSSFSEERDLLSQWRGYSGSSGVSIEFSYRKLKEMAHRKNFSIKKCLYEDKHKRLAMVDFLEREVERLSREDKGENKAFRLIQKALPLCATFKNASFAEEAEWRLISPTLQYGRGAIKVRPTGNGLVPYCALGIGTGEQPFKSELQPWRTNEDICICSVTVGPHQEQVLQMDAIGALFDAHDAAIYGISRSFIPFRQL